ncbi:MAG: carboxypeptidase regulatory-like domain-containing protein [Acidobacteriota bacterium]|nr:carboxypeptidase regulatory-like domain-containing protein [Acidobacteriota bacterium]
MGIKTCAFAFLAASVFTVTLSADVTGVISGIVRDSTNGLVVQAQVSAINADTNFTRETMSGTDGEYRLLALPPGHYKVTAAAPGFEQYVATGINLQVNDELRVDVKLQVGGVKETVTVEANPVQVETESTQLGQVIGTKQILSLPLNGRSFLDLLGLQAGVAPTTSGSIQQDRPVSGGTGGSSVGNVSVNGQRETANAFLVNGGDVSEGRNNGAGLIPNLDSIQEFRLITNSFDAEYGKFSGSIMNAITKSGTNGFHGDVFEFIRNDKFDARNFFDPTNAELRRNQFGYAFGGPFIKNKLFWFTDYQGTRQVAGASTGSVSVPTLDQRAGIFQPGDFLDANGNQTLVNGDYWAQLLSQRLGYPVYNTEPYSGCSNTTDCVFPGGIIPQRAFSKPASAILPYIPVPNLGGSTYSDASQKNSVRDDKMGQRVDFVNEKTGNWSFYYEFDDSTVDAALPANGGNIPGFSSVTPTRAQQAVLNNTKTFGSAQVNDFRLSFFRTSTVTDQPTGGLAKLSDLGFVTGPGTLGIIPSGPPGFPQTVPPIYFNNFNMGVPTLTTFQPNNTYMLADNFSKVVGRHSLKFGGEFRYLQINERNTCAPNGDFRFDGSETGIDYADFLLGAPVSYNQCSQQFLDSRTRYGALFVQDAFKLKPNLTVNLGLRWEVSMPWYDTENKIETIVPGEQSTVFPTAPKGWVVPGDPGIPSTLAPTRYNNFAPRVGIAYSPGFSDGILGKLTGGPGKTSIRAAYGIYYTSIEDLNLFYEVGDAPFGLYWVSPQPVLFDQPFQTRADGSSQGQRFPFTFPVAGSPANKTLDYSVYLPLSNSPGYSIHNRLPYAEDYNFTIQRELSTSTVLTVGYVGTQGHKLIAQYAANPGDPALCMQLNQLGATPTCGRNGEQVTYALPNGQQVFGTRDALGPAFGSGNTFTANIANSNYNSFQASLERRASDVTFLLAYTYSKAIDDASGFNDWVNSTNYRLSRSLSSFDLTHNFVASYNWALPLDRAFTGAPKRLTQGWQLVGISRFATGFPIQLSEGGDYSLVGEGSTDTPDLIGPVHTQDAHKPGPNGPNTYFLPDAFASEQLGHFGTANRRFFHGPGTLNTDFALLKNTKVTESTSIEFRAEFFNVFNHTQFSNPSGSFTSSNFGVVTSARAPRIGQFSTKFIW